jgi:hypothetical protein
MNYDQCKYNAIVERNAKLLRNKVLAVLKTPNPKGKVETIVRQIEVFNGFNVSENVEMAIVDIGKKIVNDFIIAAIEAGPVSEIDHIYDEMTTNEKLIYLGRREHYQPMKELVLENGNGRNIIDRIIKVDIESPLLVDGEIAIGDIQSERVDIKTVNGIEYVVMRVLVPVSIFINKVYKVVGGVE